MKKYLPTILIVAAIVLVVGFVVKALTTPDSELKKQDEKQTEITQADRDALKVGATLGNAGSKVVVTEFGDYQCPACGEWHPVIKNDFLPKYQDKVLFVFKNFPLANIHKNAQAAAEAAEAAGLQGKFWEMHNMLYEKQADWENQKDAERKFEEYASSIGLDMNKFKSDRTSAKIRDLIKDDFELATKLDLPGTPAFLVNGVLVQTKNGLKDLTNAVDQELAKNQ